MAIKRGFPNGEYPSSALVSVGSGAKLNERAAMVFLRAVADAKREGVTVRPTPTTSGQPAGLAGYRSRSTQQWLRNHPMGPAPIAPVGSSTHGWGDAIDVDTGADWLWKNRSRYGLTRPIGSEPWHFQLNKTLAELGLDDDPQEDEIMAKVHVRSGEYLVTAPGMKSVITKDKAVAEALARDLLPNGIADIIKSGVSSSQWSAMKNAAKLIDPPVATSGGAVTIDYAKLGAAIASAMPTYAPVAK